MCVGTRFGNHAEREGFLINKACHVRWPCVTRGAHSDSCCYLPPRSQIPPPVFAEFQAVCLPSLSQQAPKSLCDPTQPPTSPEPSAVMSSLGDRRNSALIAPPRHDIISTRSLLAGLTRLCDVTPAHCDVIPHAPLTGSLARRCRRRRVTYLTIVAPGWRLVTLAASALWPCSAR